MAHQVIFLDIDDVLLNARALVLPENRRFLKSQRLTVDPAQVKFDPIGIEMVSRICELSAAKIVLSTSWRYSPGIAPALDALRRNGLPSSALHLDPYCPLGGARHDGGRGKARDIVFWLQQHPGLDAWVSLDNDAGLAPILEMTPTAPRGLVVQVDPMVGISAQNYAAALKHLGVGRDPDLLPFKAYQPAPAD